MKSKTSCFNRTIFWKNVTTFWPMWVLYLLYLLGTMPLFVWSQAKADNISNMAQNAQEIANRSYYIVETVLDIQLFPFPVFVFAMAAGLLVFSYLYVPRNANMIHALPVDRRELFVTNYLSGLSFLIVPQLLSFVLTLLVSLASGITHIQYLMTGLLLSVGEAFFAYSLAVLVAMFTGQMIAMPVFFFVINYLYVGCLYLVDMVVTILNYGISDFWNPGASCILSPLYYLNNNVRARLVYGTGAKAGVIEAIGISGIWLVGIYTAVAVVFVVLAYQIYKRRQIETAGDWLSIRVLKPVFRWGVAACGGILLSLFFVEAFIAYAIGIDGNLINAYPWVAGGIIVFGFICFFAAEMLLDKRFRVFTKKRLAEWGCFCAAAVLILTLFELDVFGIERRVPAKEDIETAFVYMDYPVEVAEEDLEDLRKLHAEIVANKKANLENMKNKEGYYYTTIRYYLKDGGKLERRYALPVTEEYLSDAESPAARFLEWERRAENLKKQLFGPGYETNVYQAGSIDRYGEDGTYDAYAMDEEEMTQLLEAVSRDIEAGNLGKYYAYCTGEQNVTYMNEMSFEYRSDDNYYDNYDYYGSYRGAAQTSDATSERVIGENQVYTSVRFGAECTNIIETLEKLGMIDDTWKLMTSEEYDRVVQ